MSDPLMPNRSRVKQVGGSTCRAQGICGGACRPPTPWPSLPPISASAPATPRSGDQDQARKILGVPGDHDVAFVLGVGYPADRPLRPIAKPSRRPPGEVIHHGSW
jgi:hypothetical protein